MKLSPIMATIVALLTGILSTLIDWIPKIIVIVILYKLYKKKIWPYLKQLLDDVHTLAEEARKKEP